ncbi:MAG: hypothetical protein HYT82_00535 [Candidatus Harrisonbacteria bacterium]|nr:hypothetical protein [Candidatus Harrisonbacteria bacterium]
MKALQFTFAFCDARYDDKEKRAVFTEAEYDGLAFKKEIVFTGSNGHPLKAVLLESANPQAASVAWARGAALVVLRNPDGHTVIMRSRLYHWLDLAPLARALRVEELRAQQKSLPGDLSSLGKVGVIPEVPEWFLPDWEAGNRTMLANGTKTHPDVPVTKLTGEQIMDIAVKVMNPNAWAPGFAAHCRVGNCTSGVGNKGCPLAAWNMPRCVEMRRRTLAELRLRRDAPKPAAPKAKPAPTSSPETVKERATDMSAQSAEPTAALNTTPSV